MREGDPARVSVVELHGDQVPIILQVQQPCPGHTGQGVAPLKSEGRQMGPSQPGVEAQQLDDTMVGVQWTLQPAGADFGSVGSV